MDKKSQFKHLSTGTDELLSDLDSLLLNKKDEVSTFNPLTDSPSKSKKPGAKPAKIKVDTSSKPVDETQELVEVISPPKKAEKKVSLKKKSPAPAVLKKAQLTKKTEKGRRGADFQMGSEDDFKPHSSLFSAGQLDRLRMEVYKRKAAGDRAYTIKDAVNEAFSMVMADRKVIEEFPDDFVTYTASMSMAQFEDLSRFMYEIKGGGELKYAMKYAIYEAIEMYLEKYV